MGRLCEHGRKDLTQSQRERRERERRETTCYEPFEREVGILLPPNPELMVEW